MASMMMLLLQDNHDVAHVLNEPSLETAEVVPLNMLVTLAGDHGYVAL